MVLARFHIFEIADVGEAYLIFEKNKYPSESVFNKQAPQIENTDVFCQSKHKVF
jgi:hypothetical protein